MTAKEDQATKRILLGQWIWILATAWLIIGLVCFIGCGCEDDGDTIIYEGDDIIMSTNSPGIVIKDNDGLVSVDQTTGGDRDPSIYVSGNTGRVYVVSRPTPPEPESE